MRKNANLASDARWDTIKIICIAKIMILKKQNEVNSAIIFYVISNQHKSKFLSKIKSCKFLKSVVN